MQKFLFVFLFVTKLFSFEIIPVNISTQDSSILKIDQGKVYLNPEDMSFEENGIILKTDANELHVLLNISKDAQGWYVWGSNNNEKLFEFLSALENLHYTNDSSIYSLQNKIYFNPNRITFRDNELFLNTDRGKLLPISAISKDKNGWFVARKNKVVNEGISLCGLKGKHNIEASQHTDKEGNTSGKVEHKNEISITPGKDSSAGISAEFSKSQETESGNIIKGEIKGDISIDTSGSVDYEAKAGVVYEFKLGD